MSKIDDILLEIKNYLSDENQGNDLLIREYALIYATACQDINNKLEECAKLISKDMMQDAQRINMEMRPSLSSRALKLALNKKQKLQYDKLCDLYGYSPAADIDLQVVEKLRSDSQNSELDELLMQWRKIGRGKDNAGKISILREIISLSKTDASTYRNNLQTIENQYIADLINQADAALAANDGDKLADLYKFLNDPDLLTPVQQNVLQKYRPLILLVKQGKYRKIVEQKCQEIFAAYSAMDVKLAHKKLTEYDELAKDVMFQKDPELERAIDEVRNFVREKEEEQRKNEEFSNKLNELILKLDQHGDYEKIENLYESLLQMDMPLDEVITRRVYNRREEFIADNNRRHTRKCIYGLLLAIVLTVLGFLTFKGIQNYRGFVHHQEAMVKLMAEKNYEGVITLFNEIEKNSSLELSFGDLASFKLEAERLQLEYANNMQKLQDLCKAAEVELQYDPVNLPNLRKIYDAAAAIMPEVNMPADLAERFRRIDAEKSRLETIEQNHINRVFLTNFNKFANFLKAADKELTSPYCDLPTLKIDINSAFQQVRILLQSSTQVSPNMLTNSTDLINSLEQSINAKYEYAEEMYELNSQLINPSGIQHYIELITQLPASSPEFARSRWNYAVQNNETLKSIFASTQLKTNIYNWKTLEREIAQKKINPENNPFIADFAMLLTPKDFSTRLALLGNQLKSDPFLKQFINPCYEFVFKDEKDNTWRFYAVNKPFIDRTPGMPAPKAIAFDAIKYTGSLGVTLQFELKSKNGNVEFVPLNRLDDISMPGKFVKALNIDLRSSEAPLATHHKLYADIVDKIQYMDSLEIVEETIAEAMNNLRNDNNMNIVVKAVLARKLLDFLPLVSEQGYLQYIEKQASELDKIIQSIDLASWCHPAFEIKNPEVVKNLQNFFQNFDLNLFLQYNKLIRQYHEIALSRKLSAVGIAIVDEQNRLKLIPFDRNTDCREYWFYIADAVSGKYQWHLFSPQELKNGVQADKFGLHNGDVIFTVLDNRNTRDLTEQYQRKLKEYGVNDLIWPATWPVNIR